MMAKTEVETGRIIDAYLKLRNIKEAYVRASDAVIDEFDAKLDRLSAELLDRMNKQKLKNLSSDAGVAVRTKVTIPRADDWDKFYAWIAETNSFEALERRIKKTFIEQYMEENDRAIPPGVSVMTSFKAVVKKNPSKKGLPLDGEE
jgi:exonuclease III